MKYMKTYELFGMFKKPYTNIPEEVIQDVRDILIDVEELGYTSNHNTKWNSQLIKNHKKAREQIMTITIYPKDNSTNDFTELVDILSRLADYIASQNMNIEFKIFYTFSMNNTDSEGELAGDVHVVKDPYDTEIEERFKDVEELDEVSIIIAPTKEGLQPIHQKDKW